MKIVAKGTTERNSFSRSGQTYARVLSSGVHTEEVQPINGSYRPIVVKYWTVCSLRYTLKSSCRLVRRDWNRLIRTLAVSTLASSRQIHPAIQRGLDMNQIPQSGKKLPARVTISSDEKLLVGREEAAAMLSISARALDYLVANKRIAVRRIGARVLIPVADLQRFSREDHPQRVAG